MTIDDEINRLEKLASEYEWRLEMYQNDEMPLADYCIKEFPEYISEDRQRANWLRELQRYRFEISECKAILDNPTPDVTENDRKRAMYVLQTFPDVGGDSE